MWTKRMTVTTIFQTLSKVFNLLLITMKRLRAIKKWQLLLARP